MIGEMTSMSHTQISLKHIKKKKTGIRIESRKNDEKKGPARSAESVLWYGVPALKNIQNQGAKRIIMALGHTTIVPEARWRIFFFSALFGDENKVLSGSFSGHFGIILDHFWSFFIDFLLIFVPFWTFFGD